MKNFIEIKSSKSVLYLLNYFIKIFVSFLFFSGCFDQNTNKSGDTNSNNNKKIINIKQDASFYNELKIKNDSLLQDDFFNRYYAPWLKKDFLGKKEEHLWPFKTYTSNKEYYGNNRVIVQNDFFEKMKNLAYFDNYKKINKKAITVKYSNMRAFPTDQPLFLNFNKAGEGYPFDYLQTSSVAPNKPIIVSHYSKDRRYAYVSSSFTSGWIKNTDFAFIDDKSIEIWLNNKNAFITQDNIPIYNQYNDFIFKLRIGMILPIKEDKIIVANRLNNGKAELLYSKLDPTIYSLEFLKLKMVPKIINKLLNVKYGWGGLYENRDCSSTIRDLFIPFGYWLPRNSSNQSQFGRVILLENLSIEEKIKTIKREAIAYKTLIYKQGHIVLYIGVDKNKDIVVMQNIWGISTVTPSGKDGRLIIGQNIISPLNIGEDLPYFNKKKLFIKNVTRMNILE